MVSEPECGSINVTEFDERERAEMNQLNFCRLALVGFVVYRHRVLIVVEFSMNEDS
jgi:hypothetical protein